MYAITKSFSPAEIRSRPRRRSSPVLSGITLIFVGGGIRRGLLVNRRVLLPKELEVVIAEDDQAIAIAKQCAKSVS